MSRQPSTHQLTLDVVLLMSTMTLHPSAHTWCGPPYVNYDPPPISSHLMWSSLCQLWPSTHQLTLDVVLLLSTMTLHPSAHTWCSPPYVNYDPPPISSHLMWSTFCQLWPSTHQLTLDVVLLMSTMTLHPSAHTWCGPPFVNYDPPPISSHLM